MYGPFFLRRRSIRLKGYDYAQPGAYFVTLCTQGHVCLFGDIVDGKMQLNEYGEIVRDEWFRTAAVRPYVWLYPDEFVVMPNHVHGIIWIVDTHGRGDPSGRSYHDPSGRPYHDRPRGPAPGSVGAILAQYKSIVTKRINLLRGTPGVPVWQRNYYEHIVRGERDLDAIREYILANPARWPADPENPATLERGGLP